MQAISGCGQVVRHQPSKLTFTGSNPVTRSFCPGEPQVIWGSGPVAQWSERAAHNRQVAGSNPAGPTKTAKNRAFLNQKGPILSLIDPPFYI